MAFNQQIEQGRCAEVSLLDLHLRFQTVSREFLNSGEYPTFRPRCSSRCCGFARKEDSENRPATRVNTT